MTRLLAAIAQWWFNPRCPICLAPTRNIEGHLWVDHFEPPEDVA